LVLPSYVEGMPNALLEGMAAGLPVIASRVGAIPDVVEDGVSGLLVEPRDVEALSRALARLADSPSDRWRMGKAAQDKIDRDHDAAVAVPRVVEALRAVSVRDRRRSRSPAGASCRGGSRG